ncbi:MAG TPA: LemA family protein [Candidatus Dormibacteraeota bacterium]|jgi:LemA protein
MGVEVVPVVGAIVLAAALGWVALAYNGLVRRRNRVDATWSDVDVLLRRRHDLVPNLVSTVSGYARHESAVLRAVADARSAALAASGPAAQGRAESALSSNVKSVFAVAEAYPDLKASTAFVELQDQLTATEDGLEHARQFYNDSVYGYMTATQTLPTSLIAALFGFRPRQYFQAAGSERTPVTVRT